VIDGKYKMAINDSGKILLAGFRVGRYSEEQPGIEAGPSVFDLGPRCTVQAQMHDYV
jgi:hypothetical protein